MERQNPGDRKLEHTALEAKAKVFQEFNHALQTGHDQQPDVLVAACVLVFAMDVRGNSPIYETILIN